MTHLLNIPTTNGSPFKQQLAPGDMLFVLGANGTGKSSLLQYLYEKNRSKAVRLAAHRQTWFPSSTLAFTSQQKEQAEKQMRVKDSSPEARWMDPHSNHRASLAIYNLINSQSVRARHIAEALDGGETERATQLSREPAPLRQLNQIFRLSDIPIEVKLDDKDSLAAHRQDGAAYKIEQLSDGERNALLIVAEVLTAPEQTLFLLDEPERHLHRSIAAPLLSEILCRRPDCSFVICTHDITLPVGFPSSPVLLIRSCKYTGDRPTGWELDCLGETDSVDEGLRRDILGSRRKILFVEGGLRSLDRPLYALLFPSVSVRSKESCREVERAVVGVRASSELHWVEAFGLVDNDRRTSDELASLKASFVHALSVYSVESIYYHPSMQAAVAARRAALVGGDADSLVAKATDALVAALDGSTDRLAARIAEKEVRRQIFEKVPTLKAIQAGEAVRFDVDIDAILKSEKKVLSSLVEQRNVTELLSGYPLRETPALDRVARTLGFAGRGEYERAVLKVLQDDIEARERIKNCFGDLNAVLA